MRDFSYVSGVSEGELATFSCTVAQAGGSISWRIGPYSGLCCGGSMMLTGGGYLHINCTSTETGGELVETIAVEGTQDLEGVPVECVLESPEGESHDEFSQFATIRVCPTELSGSGDTSQYIGYV